jgi:hypothetical protein
MATYRICYRDGRTEELVADWTEHRPGATVFMRQRRTRSDAPWPKGEEDRGGELVAMVPLDLVEMIERREDGSVWADPVSGGTKRPSTSLRGPRG